MPTFTYEAMNNVGQPVKDEVDAASSEEAIAKVRALGLFPTKIKEKAARRTGTAAATAGPGAAKPTRRRTVGAVSRKLLTQCTRQLSTLIDAGLPILRSLRILEQQQKPGMLRVAIRLVAEDVEGGATLSEAMGRHSKAFDRLYVNMVRAGELGGVLDVILQRLADFMEKSQALKRKVIGAMIYPIAVISFALMIVLGIMIFVVPSFETIFADMGEDLPGVTRMLLDFSRWIKNDFGWAVLLAGPVGIWMLFRLLKLSATGRYLVDSLKLNIPIFGRIVSQTSVARFSRTLGTLLAAGVPILEALQITRDTAGNEVYSRALNKVHDGIREGESFADPLRQAKIVEPMVVNMIDVGEETGELDKMLGKVADNYDDQVETLVTSMVSLMEPVMVITLGLIVGFIVIALFMPMVQLLSSVSG
ncbi:MAG: type II secretion system F family protein [Planctomycetota bacterium]|jgi:type IV pilus assembly protein PilC